MRNCKRFLATLLASVMMLSLAACSSSEPEEKEPAARLQGMWRARMQGMNRRKQHPWMPQSFKRS
ncbi:MAG: hypothetical protein HFG81_03680 [Dorea sp.]|uniref:hypothetical protein n=1 Tax=Sporofaciens musculi TaxID=2681861 RepID=UPI002170E34E|nr:hypothetical protein [Sporofaciens musculi]MCI9421800.1 hypothetical protein [Dorea sp.]